MKKIKFISGILFFFVAILFFVFSQMVERESSTYLFLQVLCGACLLFCVILIIFSEDDNAVKKLFKNVKDFFADFTGHFFSFLSKLFGNRLSSHKEGMGYIHGYQDVVSKSEPLKKFFHKKKRKKYKDMNNNEKIRYFYEMTVLQQIKKGYSFKRAFTATQTGKELLEQKRVKADKEGLFEQYNLARYCDFFEASDEMVKKFEK